MPQPRDPNSDASHSSREAMRDLERRNQQLELAQSRIRTTFDAAAIGIAMAAIDGTVTIVNRAFCEALGYDELELVGRRFVEFTHPDDLEETGRLFAELLAGVRDGYRYEKRFVRKDRSVIWMRVSVTPLRGDRREIRHLVAVLEDITTEREAAAAARERAALLRIAGRTARIGGWAIDLASRRVDWSDEIFDLLDWPRDLPPDLEGSLALCSPESLARARLAIERAATSGTPFDLELHLRTPRGRQLEVRAVGEAERDEAGTIRRVIGAFQDITASKEAERKLRAVDERLKTTLDAINEAFYLLDTEWRFIFLNRQAEELMQRPHGQLLGKVVWEEFPEAAASDVSTVFRRAMETGTPQSLEIAYAPLGHWFEARALPTPEGLAVYFRTIDDRKAAELQLRRSEERFRLLSRATNDAIWDWDLVTNDLWWNEGFESLFGFRRNEVDPSIRSWTSLIHPDDKVRIESGVHDAIASGAEGWSGEYRFRRADGSWAWVLDRGHIIRDEAGKGVRMIGGMTDLTERVRAEERLAEQAALLDEAADAILVRDLEHRVVFWNRGAEAMYGWSAAEMLGREVVSIAYEDSAPFELAMREVLATGRWQGEIRQRHRDGTMLTVFSRWALRRDAAGVPTSVLVIDTDVTERRRLEQQLLRAQRLESVGTLAGGIAHDLNNALAPVLLAIEFLRLAPEEEERDDLLGTIEAGARRAADMVRQLLTFARGVEGRRISIDPATVVQEVAKIVEETFLKGVQLGVEVESPLPAVLGDPTQLHQVLLNLCLNARDAMGQGGRLTLTASRAVVDAAFAAATPGAKPGLHVLLRIRDTGTGMPPEVLERVFDPFFTTKPVGEGTGLGLPTSKAIVESHGGVLQIYSEVGVGTEVRVFLPAAEADAEENAATDAATMPKGDGELLLVVDDEPAVRRVTRQVLERFGYRVVTAEDGVEGVSVYRRHQDEIRLVLTDLMMPRVDGPTFIAAIREGNPSLPVIAASGFSADQRVEFAGTRAATRFLAKPYTTRALLETIRDLLAGSSP